METYKLILFLVLITIYIGLVAYKTANKTAERKFVEYILEVNNEAERFLDICDKLEKAYIEYKNKVEELNSNLILQEVLAETLKEVEKVNYTRNG